MNSLTNSWQKDIFVKLDASARRYLFPMLNNSNFFLADIRLTLFRNEQDWLIVFQEIVYEPASHTKFENFITAFGSKMENSLVKTIEVITDEQGNRLWDAPDEYTPEEFSLESNEFTVRINGNLQRFALKQEDFLASGVGIDSKTPRELQILRILTYLRPTEFFLTDKELLNECGYNDSSLERFIELNDWNHPDIAADELPSKNKCFQSLINAFAENDSKLYTCPSNKWNTHWKNWIKWESW
jgi:hypothetical protein